MPEKVFWAIIASCCDPGADVSEWDEALIARLQTLPPADIAGFDHRFDQMTGAAYRGDLWAAAELINGGASDDGFYYFRCWLVGMGKKVYEAALADPDSLADVELPEEADAMAEIYGVAYQAWEALGRDEAELTALTEALGPADPDGTLVPAGWDTDDEEEVRRHLPRLAARYLDDDG